MIDAAPGCIDHAHENPPEEAQEDMDGLPFPSLLAPVELNVESKASVSLCPQEGQQAWSLSFTERDKYSKT